jgi:signal transduction histidine kinase
VDGLIGKRIGSLFPRHSPSALLFFAISLVAYLTLYLERPMSSPVLPAWLWFPVHRGTVLALTGLAVTMLVSGPEQRFRYAISSHAGLSLLLMLLLKQPEGNVLLLLLTGLLPLTVYERFPLNLALCCAYATLVALLFLLLGGFWPFAVVRLALFGITIGLTGSLMGRYRESIIPLQRYINRLEDNVTSLTRANYLSQDYAKDIEEESKTAERLRLTRDIHDTIGYTFTNTIMMLEALKVMAHSEPELLDDYLESARRNTEEGMMQIRRILRDLRSREQAEETCYWAIRKLVKVFSISTGLQVRFEFGNVDTSGLDRFRESVYHFVQEGLINAFRHGHANRVSIMMWDYGDTLRLTLDDDGDGCPTEPKPGIGITGMRERAELAGGRVVIDNYAPGFRISMHLPKDVVHG